MFTILCVRNGGEKPLPPVVDPILATVEEGIEEGRSLLCGGESYVKVTQTLAGLFQAKIGDIVHVYLISGEKVAYLLTGISYGIENGIFVSVFTGLKKA